VVWSSPALNWTAGSNRLEWSGNDEHGRRAPMGLYFFKVESDLGAQTRRFAAIH
jgi:flagellar hook assembly protein FlgD